MFAAKNELFTRPSGGYQISRSLRFNAPDTTFLNRTPASASNRRTYTWSAWVKRSAFGADQVLFFAGTGLNNDTIRFNNNEKLYIFCYNGSVLYELETTQVFRDPSAFYHLVIAFDTTQATGSNRIKLYVNGTQVTTFSTATYPSLNFDSNVDNTVDHRMGNNNATNQFSGYMTEVNFIDGQQLTPSSFGSTNADTGVWQPKAYSGAYGTNGFYLNFSDNSALTTSSNVGIGKDYSGNGNYFATNNISISAGAGNDSLVDVPTPYGVDTGVGGTVRGNYCTLNPLTTTTGTYTQGNLRYVGANQDKRPTGTISVSTGKWYWEVTLANAPYSPRGPSTLYNAFGFVLSTVFNSTTSPPVSTDALVLGDNGYYKNFSGAFTNGGVTFLSGDVLSVAVDLDANTFTFRVNNTSLATGTIGGTAGRELVPFIFSYNGDYGIMDCNFGQRAFAYTAPSGFKALCTQNLPTPTIGATTATQAGKYFNPVLYTGNGTTQTISGVGFQPDLVWCKSRSNAFWHSWIDAVRGRGFASFSNVTNAEFTSPVGKELTAFTSDGFSLGPDDGFSINSSGSTFVSWNWKANGSGSTNTAGSITSTVSANTTAGFSVVTYTGNGTANATFGHGLGVFPNFVIVKGRSAVSDWRVWARAYNGGNGYGILNATNAFTADDGSLWGSYPTYTGPTSSVITVSSNVTVNGSGATFVAYCFAEVAGYSKFGSYTGNGSADGPFVYCGFRPAFMMIKFSSTTGDWALWDTKRAPYNVFGYYWPSANTSNSEQTDSPYLLDILSNGFKIRGINDETNLSGQTLIFMAFAESPFKYALAR